MVTVRRSFARRARSFFPALAGAMVLFLITVPVIAADMALPLPQRGYSADQGEDRLL